MPIRIPDLLPAVDLLNSENIFVMTETRAMHQDVRPLKVLLLNLMPKKIETENQLIRMLSNSPLQIDFELLRIDQTESKNTPIAHLNSFYRDFNEIKNNSARGFYCIDFAEHDIEIYKEDFSNDQELKISLLPCNFKNT